MNILIQYRKENMFRTKVKINKSIHELELPDFDKYPLWRTVEYDDADGIDIVVEPILNYKRIANNEEYWIRFRGILADGTEVLGVGMMNFYTSDTFALSFNINNVWEVLHLPLAPDFVLEHSGPEQLAKKMNKDLKCVFPMTIVADIPIDILGKSVKKVVHV